MNGSAEVEDWFSFETVWSIMKLWRITQNSCSLSVSTDYFVYVGNNCRVGDSGKVFRGYPLSSKIRMLATATTCKAFHVRRYHR